MKPKISFIYVYTDISKLWVELLSDKVSILAFSKDISCNFISKCIMRLLRNFSQIQPHKRYSQYMSVSFFKKLSVT